MADLQKIRDWLIEYYTRKEQEEKREFQVLYDKKEILITCTKNW